jgi:hypothetical protein
MSINTDGAPKRMIYIGSYESGINDLLIPREVLQLAEAKLAAERATREAATMEAEKAKVLQSARTGGKLRRLLGLGGD